MIKKTLSIIFLCFLITSSEVFAANWIHTGKSSHAGEPVNDYIDSDSVVTNGDTIIFWSLTVWEKPDMFIGAKLELQKWEAKQKRQGRALEIYRYDANKKLIHSIPSIKSNSFTSYDANSPGAKMIEAAFKNAKAGKDSGQKPALP
ncbi:MAG: hypothetical protein EG826_13215 [Deltaproteobacteria bacterium]|nr:hypothetical protein [Deltaproteobacteria bacterium]